MCFSSLKTMAVETSLSVGRRWGINAFFFHDEDFSLCGEEVGVNAFFHDEFIHLQSMSNS